jgi:hypothetical protein
MDKWRLPVVQSGRGRAGARRRGSRGKGRKMITVSMHRVEKISVHKRKFNDFKVTEFIFYDKHGQKMTFEAFHESNEYPEYEYPPENDLTIPVKE